MEDFISINKWAVEDRPREKLLLKGQKQLTDAELLTILIGNGTRSRSALDLAKDILNRFNNDLHRLGKAELKDLMQVKGIGQAKAITIMSALELGRRRKEQAREKRSKIRQSADVYEFLHPYLHDLNIEEFWVLLLNRANEILRPLRISSGGVSGTVVDPRLVFKEAIIDLASSIIVCHNHPSGQLRPLMKNTLKFT
ncbi:MAG: DNA repair protein RadC [Cyclobacteriaceae bacterium]|nr:DNA repair protein RadC [Cyclobacteriaceae bacterium]MCH8517203.1 DNA repair protein RadC [Cyclobacteriaceae bacterium]